MLIASFFSMEDSVGKMESSLGAAYDATNLVWDADSRGVRPQTMAMFQSGEAVEPKPTKIFTVHQSSVPDNARVPGRLTTTSQPFTDH